MKKVMHKSYEAYVYVTTSACIPSHRWLSHHGSCRSCGKKIICNQGRWVASKQTRGVFLPQLAQSVSGPVCHQICRQTIFPLCYCFLDDHALTFDICRQCLPIPWSLNFCSLTLCCKPLDSNCPFMKGLDHQVRFEATSQLWMLGAHDCLKNEIPSRISQQKTTGLKKLQATFSPCVIRLHKWRKISLLTAGGSSRQVDGGKTV